MAKDDTAGQVEGVVDDVPDDEAEDSAQTDTELLKDSRDGLKACIEDEQIEREKMADDLRFATLDQWPADIRAQRENDIANGPRPCLTVDQINQYITQVSNDMASNRPAIKTRPENTEAHTETAKIFDGRIRHIEDRSSAYIAYQTAGDSAVTMGLGFLRIVADYIAPDSFDQELLIKRIPDTFSTYLSAHIMPDGSDAEKGWILDKMPLATFKRDYPKARIADNDFAGLGIIPVWKTPETVTVCEYFYKKYTPAVLLFLEDGKTLFKEEYDKLPQPRPDVTGRRKSQKCSVHWCKHTGAEVLDKRELKGKYIPIIEEVGKEKIVDGKRLLWGLVRPAKDSLRAFNYWISAMTEKMALSPKAPIIGAVGQFASQGEKWDKANVNNYAKLEYDPIDVNGNVVPAPRRQDPVQMEAAMANMLSIMQNNVKSSLGMYKAAIGDTGSQQSGRAILALKKESDVGTSHFGMNQSISITHAGRILVDLIPYYTDTKQILSILGEDGKQQQVAIDPEQKEAMREVVGSDGRKKRIFNLNVGKYGVTVTVGPGYTTSRQEASTVMTELANSAKDPASAAIMRYGAVKNSDFHGSDEITRMLKATLPPQVLQAETDDVEMPPAALAKIAEMGQQMQQMDEAGKALQAENQQLKSGAKEADAKIQASHAEKMEQLKLDEAVEKERARLADERMQREYALKKWQVEQEVELERMKAAIGIEKDIDGAIAKITRMADAFLIKTTGMVESADGADAPTNGDASESVAKLQDDFLKGVEQIIASLQAKKTVTMTLPGGRKATAEVSTGLNS